LASSKVGQLGSNDKTSDTGRGEGGQNTRDEGRDGKTGNITSSRGGKLAENTDLDTQGTDVAETAESVGGDELRTGGKAVVLGGGVVGGEVSEGVVLVGDDLLGNETGDGEDISCGVGSVGAGNTEEERDGEEKVSENQLESKIVVAGEVDVASDPGKDTVDESDKGDDAEKRGNDGTSDLDTQPSTVGESVKSVLGLVLVIIGNDNATSCEGLLGLGVSHLGNGQRGRDGHDTRGHKSLTVKTETNVPDKG